METFYVAITLIIGCGVLILVTAEIRRGARSSARLAELVAAAEQDRDSREPGTDPALVERLESLERRMEALAADAAKQYRKIAQERRRIEAANGDGGDDDDDTPAGLDQLRLAVGQPGPTGKRRLLRRRPR